MRSRSLFTVSALTVAAFALLAGCASTPADDTSASSTPPSAPETPTTRTIDTEQGEVTIPGDPQRVVVLNYALAGYLYDLDVPVVATTSEDFDYDAAFSELWGDAPEEDGTEFLSWGMDGFDAEEILSYQPDLIIAGGLGLPNGLAVKAYDQLSTIAPTVIVPKTLSTWQDQFSFLAEDVLNRGDDYAALVSVYDDRVAEVKKNITLPTTPVATLTITADGTPFVLFEDTGLATLLDSLGFTTAPVVTENNLPPYSEGGDMAELSSEQVGQILADVPTLFITGFNSDTTDVATLAAQPVWAALSSFANDSAFDLPYWAVRGDYDETLAVLDIIEKQFG